MYNNNDNNTSNNNEVFGQKWTVCGLGLEWGWIWSGLAWVWLRLGVGVGVRFGVGALEGPLYLRRGTLHVFRGPWVWRGLA